MLFSSAFDDFTPGGSYGALDDEVKSLTKQYFNPKFTGEDGDWDSYETRPGHWQSCAPQSCTYVEGESWKDILLKTIALASPIFSTVMAGAAIIYGLSGDHWSEREGLFVDGLRKESSARTNASL